MPPPNIPIQQTQRWSGNLDPNPRGGEYRNDYRGNSSYENSSTNNEGMIPSNAGMPSPRYEHEERGYGYDQYLDHDIKQELEQMTGFGEGGYHMGMSMGIDIPQAYSNHVYGGSTRAPFEDVRGARDQYQNNGLGLEPHPHPHSSHGHGFGYGYAFTAAKHVGHHMGSSDLAARVPPPPPENQYHQQRAPSSLETHAPWTTQREYSRPHEEIGTQLGYLDPRNTEAVRGNSRDNGNGYEYTNNLQGYDDQWNVWQGRSRSQTQSQSLGFGVPPFHGGQTQDGRRAQEQDQVRSQDVNMRDPNARSTDHHASDERIKIKAEPRGSSSPLGSTQANAGSPHTNAGQEDTHDNEPSQRSNPSQSTGLAREAAHEFSNPSPQPDASHNNGNSKANNGEDTDSVIAMQDDEDDDVPLIQLRHDPQKQSSHEDGGHKQTNTLTSTNQAHPAPARPSRTIQFKIPKEKLLKATTTANSHPESPPAEISWKLPTYEAIYDAPTPSSPPSARISLPGLIRHPILLTPDYPTLEFLILRTLFLPSHSHQTPPPPDPKLTLLNYHTITVLVIETFATFCTPDTRSEDIDIDEVFFATLDKWRVGREMKRGNHEVIRGVQEFVDVALDVCFWVKKNGVGMVVGREREGRERKVRCDKGVKRGPRGGGGGAEREGNLLVGRRKEKEVVKGKEVKKEKEKEKEGKTKVKTKAVGAKVKDGRVEKKKKKN